MDHQQWSLRVGACAIACALLLRLSATGFFQPVADGEADAAAHGAAGIKRADGRIVQHTQRRE